MDTGDRTDRESYSDSSILHIYRLFARVLPKKKEKKEAKLHLA